ncbi:MAG: hypothetical protein R3A78_00660 [Polyangiales bacterium]|nr:hypothetical protein [Myxococcales bacterium]
MMVYPYLAAVVAGTVISLVSLLLGAPRGAHDASVADAARGGSPRPRGLGVLRGLGGALALAGSLGLAFTAFAIFDHQRERAAVAGGVALGFTLIADFAVRRLTRRTAP